MSNAANADAQAMEVLRFIRAHIDEHGYPPSRREVAEHGGFTPSTAQRIIEQLRDRGLIRVGDKIPRSTSITESGMTALTEVM